MPFSRFPDPVADCSIEDYAAIGDCRTVALVSRFGSIDWWCAPDFASPSCFASLLDRERGGRFAITPRQVGRVEQEYLRATNVLLTRLHCEGGGVVELTDFMTLDAEEGAEPEIPHHAPQEIVRIARCVSGEVQLEVLFEPRPDYARQRPQLQRQDERSWRCAVPGFEAGLACTFPLEPAGDGTLRACVRLQAGHSHVAVFRTGGCCQQRDLHAYADEQVASTLSWWRAWCSRSRFAGEHADDVLRSALALKLLTHRKTGAVVAAATTSLPESDDTGARNWDYRFCWLRDTSLVLHAFSDLGFVAESRAFLRWLLHATRDTRPRLQALYGIHGETRLEEKELQHLRGYHGIGPVRIGNAAALQSQHDVYGEVILTACEAARMGGRLAPDEKDLLVELCDTLCRVWREPDHGIWEIRLPPRHNTHSKLMCWAGLDRALILHREQGLQVDPQRLASEREAVRQEIERHGFHPSVNAYTGYYGSDAADASVLLMPRLGYVPADHPRMRGTMEHVLRELDVAGLLYRYPPGVAYDGVPGDEHLFAICSFWCVDCLARQGRLQEAHDMYERLLALRNHVGLFAEEYRVKDGRPMGNFPQAFSHVGAITAALSLARAGQKADAVG